MNVLVSLHRCTSSPGSLLFTYDITHSCAMPQLDVCITSPLSVMSRVSTTTSCADAGKRINFNFCMLYLSSLSLQCPQTQGWAASELMDIYTHCQFYYV